MSSSIRAFPVLATVLALSCSKERATPSELQTFSSGASPGPDAAAVPVRTPAIRSLPAWANADGKIVSRTRTVGGELAIVEFRSYERYVVRLGSVALLVTDSDDPGDELSGFVKPELVKALGPVKPFADVFLMQQYADGNACNGGPLWFLGISTNGSYAISDRIDFCGGRDPVVSTEGNSVKVVLPGGPPNRGTGYIPTEVWLYSDGRVRKAATAR